MTLCQWQLRSGDSNELQPSGPLLCVAPRKVQPHEDEDCMAKPDVESAHRNALNGRAIWDAVRPQGRG